MSTLGNAAKDGFRALLVVLGIGVILVLWLGYGGLMITALIGMIFFAAFITLHVGELAGFVLSIFQKKDHSPPPSLPVVPIPQPHLPWFCSQCGAPWAAGAETALSAGRAGRSVSAGWLRALRAQPCVSRIIEPARLKMRVPRSAQRKYWRTRRGLRGAGADMRISVCVSHNSELVNPKVGLPSGSQTAKGGGRHPRYAALLQCRLNSLRGFLQLFRGGLDQGGFGVQNLADLREAGVGFPPLFLFNRLAGGGKSLDAIARVKPGA